MSPRSSWRALAVLVLVTAACSADDGIEGSPPCSWEDDRLWVVANLPDEWEAPRLVGLDGDGSSSAFVDRSWVVSEPRPSPDGESVAVTRYNDGYGSAPHTDIWVIGADGSGGRALTDGGLDQDPDWSPDGSTVAFSRWERRATGPHIATVPAGGGEPTSLTATDGGRDIRPRWSPDGTTIAFLRFSWGTPSVWTVGADGSDPTELAGLAGNNAGELTWSPDARHLVIGGPDGLQSVAMADGAVTVISREAHAAAWSADGQRLYVLEPREPGGGYRVAQAGQDEAGTVTIGRALSTPEPVLEWSIAVGGCAPPS